MKKIIQGDIVNGHKILSRDLNNFLVICGKCNSFANKSKARLYSTKGCIRCAERNNQYTTNEMPLKTKCEILGVKYTTVKSRIQRGWTEKEALYQTKKVFHESFTDKDLKYLSKYNESTYEINKKKAMQAEKKYKKNTRV